MTPLHIAETLCKEFEGLRLSPYLCPAGVPSIGFGSTFYEDGTMVTMSDEPITSSRASKLLMLQLNSRYMPGALAASPSLVDHPEALGAIIDFCYNLGIARYRSSTLRTRIDQGNWDEARLEIKRWARASGRVLPGLVRRRAAEAAFL